MLGLVLPQLFGYESLLHALDGTDSIVFYMDPSRSIINYSIVTLPICEAHNFKGKLVVVNVDTLYAVSNLKPIFYVREIEWNKGQYYENQHMHFTRKDIQYVSSSKWIQEKLEKSWGTPSVVIEEINFKKILEV